MVRPVGTGSFYDETGAKVEAAAIKGSFVASNGKAFVGVTVPEGATFTVEGGQPRIHGAKYVVFSFLPAVEDFAAYNAVAKNKVAKGTFKYAYDPAKGQITTTFDLTTTNLDTGAAGDTFLGFLPHHWRKGKLGTAFNTYTYKTIFGTMKVAKGQAFTLSYDFTGLVPWMPAGRDMTAEQKTRLTALINHHVKDNGLDGNTYAKGFGEKSQIMAMAKELGIADWEGMKTILINQFKNWFNFDAGETTGRFFAMYPEYGALIGFPAGYGSQVFNDLHFHNGYFITGAARVALLDDEFKADYGEMAKLVARTYANWGRYEDGDKVFEPHLRTFDCYTGHNYAGGTGDGGGNNQESSSEAIQSSYGLFMLGVALDDPEIWQLGATLYYLETQAAAEYWFDVKKENYPVEYKHKYVGILRSYSITAATYFDGDFGWPMAIQSCPCDSFYYHWSEEPAGTLASFKSMIEDRIADGKVGNNDIEGHIKQAGAYMGGYLMNIIVQVDPAQSVKIQDNLYATGGEWETHLNCAHNYFNAQAFVTYGHPAPGYHTSIPTGVVYVNPAGKLTYLLYNAKAAAVAVQVFKGADVIETITVPAKTFYNSAAA